jgi:hypothetical protein
MHLTELNRKEMKIGSVAYYVESDDKVPYKWHVRFGIVEENYPSEVALRLYEPINTQTIDGIPKKEIKIPSEWRKLPRGWSYDTRLIEYGNEPYPVDPRGYDIRKPEDILRAIEDGLYVRVSENDHRYINTEVTKNGWRIISEHHWGDWHPDYISLYFHDVYSTYEEAQAEIDTRVAEFKRQAALSDYDWSVEQIDKSLSRALAIGYITEEQSGEFMKRLLELKNVEDIETRVYDGGVQWKYWKNKRWKKLE